MFKVIDKNTEKVCTVYDVRMETDVLNPRTLFLVYNEQGGWRWRLAYYFKPLPED